MTRKTIGSLHTVGHSTRSIDEFVALLELRGIEILVDVRSIPRSRTYPQFNFDTLPGTLSAWNIDYIRIPELGGRRAKSKVVPPEVNAFWTHQSFHNYADFALSAEFQNGLTQLEQLGQTARCAIMCSEAVWWRCHRRIIADYLVQRRWNVFHIMSVATLVHATLNSAACVDGPFLLYPAPDEARVEPRDEASDAADDAARDAVRDVLRDATPTVPTHTSPGLTNSATNERFNDN